MSKEAGKTKKQSLVHGIETEDDLPDVSQEHQEQVKDGVGTPQDTTSATSASSVQEKYKGKTFEDIVRMHEEAEKLLGRQGSELGELRRTVDDFIKVQLSTASAGIKPNQQEQEEVDFFKEPEKAISTIIEKHPALQEARITAAQLKAQEEQKKLKQAHPDFKEIIHDSGFQDWIRSNRVRTELFLRADRNYDFDAADELLSTWKLLKGKQDAGVDKTVVQEKRQQEYRAAGVTSGGGDAPDSSTQGKKIYRRADIIELMRFHPDRYRALQPEIYKAYQEGRVR